MRTLSLLFLSFTLLSGESEIEQLKRQAKEILDRIGYLEQKDELNSKKIEKFGNLKLKNSKTTLSIGGRVQFDAFLNNPSSGGSYNSSDVGFNSNSIPTTKNSEKWQNSLSLRESRFWLRSETPTDYGDLKTLIEIDFWGRDGNEKISNSHGVRLRHSYIKFNRWTLGQTNSTFMSIVIPDSLNSPVDDIFARQPLLRYSYPLESGFLDFAIENSDTTLIDSDFNSITPNDDRFFDFIFRFRDYGESFDKSISLMAREIRVDDEVDRAKVGYGVNLAGRYTLFSGDSLNFGFSFGDAIGRYIALNSFKDGYLDRDNFKLNRVVGGDIAYKYLFNEKLNANFILSRVISKEPKRVSLNSYHLNLLYYPLLNIRFGIEYVYAKKSLKEAEVEKLHFSATYDF